MRAFFPKITVLICTSLLLMSFAEGQKLKQKRVHSNVTVGIPTDFRQMNEDEVASKYRTVQRSLGLYTEQYGAADLGITLKQIDKTSWGQADMPILESIYRATIVETFGQVNFLQEGRRIVNGQEVIYFEFVGRISSEAAYGNRVSGRYHFIQYSLVEGDIIVFNFNCSARLQQKWQATARAVMKSVKIKPQ